MNHKRKNDEKEVTWLDVMTGVWALALMVIALISLVAASDAYFIKQNNANAALYLSISTWLNLQAKAMFPKKEQS